MPRTTTRPQDHRRPPVPGDLQRPLCQYGKGAALARLIGLASAPTCERYRQPGVPRGLRSSARWAQVGGPAAKLVASLETRQGLAMDRWTRALWAVAVGCWCPVQAAAGDTGAPRAARAGRRQGAASGDAAGWRRGPTSPQDTRARLSRQPRRRSPDVRQERPGSWQFSGRRQRQPGAGSAGERMRKRTVRQGPRARRQLRPVLVTAAEDKAAGVYPAGRSGDGFVVKQKVNGKPPRSTMPCTAWVLGHAGGTEESRDHRPGQLFSTSITCCHFRNPTSSRMTKSSAIWVAAGVDETTSATRPIGRTAGGSRPDPSALSHVVPSRRDHAKPGRRSGNQAGSRRRRPREIVGARRGVRDQEERLLLAFRSRTPWAHHPAPLA